MKEIRKKNYPVEYAAYHNALQRCTNPKRTDYKHYADRGIEFRFDSFKEFFEELGKKPKGRELDRKENDGHYAVGNVHWASKSESMRNRRRWKVSAQGRANMRAAAFLRRHSSATKKKIAAKAFGRAVSAETRAKISTAKKLWWAQHHV